MATRNLGTQTFTTGDDDFKSLTFDAPINPATGSPIGLRCTLRQEPSDKGPSLEAEEYLADLPAAKLGGITKAQFRAALKGWVDHLRAKGGLT